VTEQHSLNMRRIIATAWKTPIRNPKMFFSGGLIIIIALFLWTLLAFGVFHTLERWAFLREKILFTFIRLPTSSNFNQQRSTIYFFWHRVIFTKERPVIALSKREGKCLKMFMIVFGPIFLINLFYNAALSTLKPFLALEASNSFIAYK
jgi:hypothetical protein